MLNLFTPHKASVNQDLIQSNSVTRFDFELLPEDLQIRIYPFFDEMSLIAMQNVSKIQNEYAKNDELWENLSKRIRFYKPILPSSATTFKENHNTFLTRVTLILERKIPKNCDVKEWLDSVFISSDAELVNKSLDFVRRSKLSRMDNFVCMPFNSSNYPSLPELPYLNINLVSNEQNIFFKLRSIKVGRIEEISEKYIFSIESTHSTGIDAYISTNYGDSIGTHFRTGQVTNQYDPIFGEIGNKFSSIVSMGRKFQKQKDILSNACKVMIAGIVLYSLPKIFY